MTNRWQFSQPCRTPGLWARATHWARGALPEPMPVSDTIQPGLSSQPLSILVSPSLSLSLRSSPGVPIYLQRHGGWCPQCGRLPPQYWQWPQCLLGAVSPGYASADMTSLSLGRGKSQGCCFSIPPCHCHLQSHLISTCTPSEENALALQDHLQHSCLFLRELWLVGG